MRAARTFREIIFGVLEREMFGVAAHFGEPDRLVCAVPFQQRPERRHVLEVAHLRRIPVGLEGEDITVLQSAVAEDPFREFKVDVRAIDAYNLNPQIHSFRRKVGAPQQFRIRKRVRLRFLEATEIRFIPNLPISDLPLECAQRPLHIT